MPVFIHTDDLLSLVRSQQDGELYTEADNPVVKRLLSKYTLKQNLPTLSQFLFFS
jgi:hypothetical protein